jgi:hypothetical protein
MANVIMTELEKRQKLLIEVDEKSEKAKALRAEADLLDKEVSEVDKDVLVAEIDELTGYAVKLGFIEVQEEVADEVGEPVAEDPVGV